MLDFNRFIFLYSSEFAQSFDFCGKDIDDALRQFQSYFKLTVWISDHVLYIKSTKI